MTEPNCSECGYFSTPEGRKRCPKSREVISPGDEACEVFMPEAFCDAPEPENTEPAGEMIRDLNSDFAKANEARWLKLLIALQDALAPEVFRQLMDEFDEISGRYFVPKDKS